MFVSVSISVRPAGCFDKYLSFILSLYTATPLHEDYMQVDYVQVDILKYLHFKWSFPSICEADLTHISPFFMPPTSKKFRGHFGLGLSPPTSKKLSGHIGLGLSVQSSA